MASDAITLGEKLSRRHSPEKAINFGARVWGVLQRLVSFGLGACIIALSLWWFLGWSDLDLTLVLMLLSVLVVSWWFVNGAIRRDKKHYLLLNDRQGFLHGLRLDEITAIIDGSNIYHLGRDNKLDAQALGEIADLLRTQGYRIVCFFDANIFFTLGEHGAFQRNTRHSIEMLEHIFGLNSDEIYVMPSGVQADQYILECLKYLPISFAVTNDRYRDYARQYPTVMKDNLWRKGVVISGGEARLLQHRVQDQQE